MEFCFTEHATKEDIIAECLKPERNYYVGKLDNYMTKPPNRLT